MAAFRGPADVAALCVLVFFQRFALPVPSVDASRAELAEVMLAAVAAGRRTCLATSPVWETTPFGVRVARYEATWQAFAVDATVAFPNIFRVNRQSLGRADDLALETTLRGVHSALKGFFVGLSRAVASSRGDLEAATAVCTPRAVCPGRPSLLSGRLACVCVSLPPPLDLSPFGCGVCIIGRPPGSRYMRPTPTVSMSCSPPSLMGGVVASLPNRPGPTRLWPPSSLGTTPNGSPIAPTRVGSVPRVSSSEVIGVISQPTTCSSLIRLPRLTSRLCGSSRFVRSCRIALPEP